MQQPQPALVSAGSNGFIDLESLYRQHHQGIRRYVATTFGSGPPDPDDVVHFAFEKFATLDRPEEIANPKAFLIRSARNYVIDQHRRMSVRRAFLSVVRPLNDVTDPLHAGRVLEGKQHWAAIEKAITGLDPRSREMLMLNRLHGVSCAEIARRQKCSATHVKTLIARALVACERALA